MKKPIIWGIILLMVIGVVAVYFVFDPSSTGWFPKCFLYQLTGYKCPGCGSQRMLHAVLHGDMAEAFRYNAFLVLVLCYFAAIAVGQMIYKRYRRLSDVLLSPPAAYTFLVCTFLWWILRNVYGW